MNAGKSTAMLQVAHNYEEQDQQVRLFTAAIDNRYGVGKVTRAWVRARDRSVRQNTDFLQTIDKKVACLLVDEAQFLSKEQVKQLHQLAQVRGVPVITYGLRSDFWANRSPVRPTAGAGDDIEEIKNICTCGKKATMNIRVDENGKRIKEGEQISIGGNESYRQACGRCFYSEIH
jgi:thymidine kinase